MPQNNLLQNVVFLDRDGVINRDRPDYIKGWSEFEFLPGSLSALRDLKTGGFVTIVITNQSAVGRGLISPDGLEDLHRRMRQAVAAAGGEIKDIFFCPHRPSEACSCRKPEPGLIARAQKKFKVDLAAAVMVGDRVKDIQCARRAGCGRAVLVRTGNGKNAAAQLAAGNITVDHVADDLAAAVRWILRNHQP